MRHSALQSTFHEEQHTAPHRVQCASSINYEHDLSLYPSHCHREIDKKMPAGFSQYQNWQKGHIWMSK